MSSGQWLGVAIMLAMCLGLIWWIVWAVRKGKKGEIE
jgi:hypothetical protein